MSLTFQEFQEVLARELEKPQKEPRVDLVPMTDDYYEEVGAEIDRHPVGGHSRRYAT